MDERRTNKHLHKTPEEYMGCKPSTHQNKKDKSTAMKAGTLMVGNQEEKRLHGTLNDEKIKDECVTAIEVEKHACKPRGRKKKRKCQNSQGKVEIDPSLDKVNTSGLKTNTSQAILSPSTYISNEKRSHLTSRKCFSSLDNKLKKPTVNNVAVTTGGKDALADSFLSASATSEASESTVVSATDQTEDDASKERLLSNSEGERQATEMQPKKQKSSTHKKSNNLRLSEETFHRKSYSAIVKERIQNQHRAPKILLNIHTVKMADASENICLCCQFSGVSTDCFIVWTKEGTVLVEEKISTGDKSESSFTIAHASCKDLGWYECCLRSPQGEASQKFHLTSDVLNELVPCHNQQVHNSKEVGEDVKCAPLLFKEDFLSEQFFGKEQPASILTEEVHFGEGMHRKAFRAKVLAGLMPLFNPGHHCVLKVHNAISYGAKNNEELIQKNYNLAIEECYVQNTAREYIKAYTAVAKSAEIFGKVPEIIPIYLVHRPTNDIPYATLEEELVGEFVKYSVKDGKEMNLMRRDSEAGQKCCAFQHWVYHITEGNLLVTDMQGVGMKLTDVGIATCKKGYKGFRGNCATSFIDQFKALHQCNKFCQLLGLKSLQAFQQPSKRAAPATQLKAKSSPRNASTPVLKSEC